MTQPQGLAYLATPYTKYPRGIWTAFFDASEIAARLLSAGVKVYSPIAHTHPLAIFGGLDPLDHSIWMPFDEAMMTAASVLIVAHMEGWDSSKGIALEIEHFEARGKPIFDLDPKTLVMTRRGERRLLGTSTSFEKMSLDELRAERDFWQSKINAADKWGASLFASQKFHDQCARFIARREAESKCDSSTVSTGHPVELSANGSVGGNEKDR